MVGVPDERWGEVVVAVVVWPRATTCRRRDPAGADGHLAGFKHPRRVVAVEALPTNASGKVDKVAVRSLV